MENSLRSRVKNAVKHGWNAFLNRDPTEYSIDYGQSYYHRPDRPRLTKGNERSIVTSVYNKIAIDVAAITIQHVQLDKNGRFLEVRDSGLNTCLTLDANIDQTGRAFIQDVVMSMLDEGCVAIVPVDTSINPKISGSYDIHSMRTGKIIEWFPKDVKVRLYNERNAKHEDLILPKSMVAIIENPLYAVINEPNSTMKRLIRKLNLLDAVDEQSGSGKLDLIIQLPYVIKTEARQKQADNRIKSIENQLRDSPFGIAYTDGTERITQLNRPVENNLMKQIEYLTSMLYSQLGMTQSILDGSADEGTMLNYYNRTSEPIISAIVDEMKRKFLTKTARTQLQSIMFFRDPFKLVPVKDLAEIADKMTRNEIMSSNEIRQVIGLKPSKDPKADMLVNSNLNQTKEANNETPEEEINQEEEIQNGEV
ncbi:MAG: phage portal protein [Burkholderiaceae bacterium]|nr:phage portal protein [Burkholderiaceae bacterium]